jgi:NTE family protein
MKISLKILLLLSLISLSSVIFAQSDSVFKRSDSTVSRIELNFRNGENFDSSHFNIFPKKTNNKKIALVLSGGGARGLSHIGVLKVLEKYDVGIDMIAGTSIGAITGGLYSSGYSPAEIEQITKSIDWKTELALTNKYTREFLFIDQKKNQDKNFLSLSFDGLKPMLPTSLSSGQQIASLINVLLLNARFKPKNDFSTLKVPISIVATNLDNGQRIVLKDGNLSESIKASFTFPLLYTPTIVKGKNLVDGGLTANIPVDIARNDGADYTITVNSTSPLKTAEDLKDPINTADQILSITLAQLNEEQLKSSDIVIQPELGRTGATDFLNIPFLIKQGEIATENSIAKILNDIQKLEESASPNSNNFVFNSNVYFDSDLIPDSLKKSIEAEQKSNFVKYTAIEKKINDIYKTGFFEKVMAEIIIQNGNNNIAYKTEKYPKLNSILLNYSKGSDIRRYKSETVVKDSLRITEFKWEIVKSGGKEDFEIVKSVFNAIERYGIENFSRTVNNRNMYRFYEDVLGHLRDEELSFVDVDKFYFNHLSGELEIYLTSGKISSVKLSGNKKTRGSLILNEITIADNKPVTSSSLKESLGNVYGTNLFSQVSMTLNSDNPIPAPVLDVNLIEKGSRNLLFSFRVDNERKLQGYLELRNENLFGSGNELSGLIKGGLRDREYRMNIKSYKFFGTIFTYDFAAYYKFRDIYNYVEEINNTSLKYIQLGEYRDIDYGASFLLGTQIEKIGTVYAQVFYDYYSRNQLQGEIPEENDLKLFKLKLNGRIDTEDKYPFPTKGASVNYYYESARNQFGAGLTYTKIYFDISHYFSLGKPSVIKPKFIFGFGDKTTPAYELFSLGGENSFYGMVEDEMRGRQILLGSLEYRYLLPFQLFFDSYLAARYDLGRVWENTEDIRFKDLRHGIGVAAMFDTPIGKASFSVGRTFIIRNGFAEGSIVKGNYVFYFSIGYDL